MGKNVNLTVRPFRFLGGDTPLGMDPSKGKIGFPE